MASDLALSGEEKITCFNKLESKLKSPLSKNDCKAAVLHIMLAAVLQLFNCHAVDTADGDL